MLRKIVTMILIRSFDNRTHYARSAFTHLGLRRKMYDFDCFTSQPVNWCILKCALLTFSSTSNRLAEIWKGDFWPPGLVLGGSRMSGIGPFDSSSRVSISTLLTHKVHLQPSGSNFKGDFRRPVRCVWEYKGGRAHSMSCLWVPV